MKTNVGLELREPSKLMSYAEHEELLRTLRSDRHGLRSARERFADQFPLAPTIWLEWLNDEIELARSTDDRRLIADFLFPRAIKDYLSVDIAESLISFQAMRLKLQEIDLDEFRRCFEDLNIPNGPCRHYLDGLKIWRKYRGVLKAHGIPADEQAAVFSNQLSHPLRGNDEEVGGDLPPPSESGLSVVATSSSDLVEVLDAFESKLVKAGSDSRDFSGIRNPELTLRYAAYAACEEERDLPSACIIWERCVAECFLDESAWVMYNNYCRRSRQSSETNRERLWRPTITGDLESLVMYRAVRNVPWSMQSWTALVSALSRNEHLEDRALKLRNVISMAAPNVMQSKDSFGVEQLSVRTVLYASRLRQGGSDAKLCQSIIDTAVSFNITGSDSWAAAQSVAATLEPDPSLRQQVLEKIVAYRAQEAAWWIFLAKTYGERNSRRAVYYRALKELVSVVQLDTLAQAWLMFELTFDAESGSQERLASNLPRKHVEYRDDGFDDAMRALHARRSELEHNRTSIENLRSPAGGLSRKRSNPVPLKPRRKKGKQAGEESGPHVDDVGAPTKRGGQESRNDGTEVAPHAPANEHGGSENLGCEKQANLRIGSNDQAHPGDGKGTRVLTEYEPRVIYVNNLSYTATEDHIHNAFSSVGKVQEVRLPRRKDGALKGFAYVEFEDDAAVEAALALDKMQITGREAWVRRSKPPKPKRVAGDVSAKPVDTVVAVPGTSSSGGDARPGASRRYGFKPAFRTPRKFLQTSLTRSAGTGYDVDMEPRDQNSLATAESIAAVTDERSQLKQDDFRAMLARK
jgi:squamous cell carcinoma antigen recognized by T-cells 3